MFSWSYMYKATSIFLRYPQALPKILKGPQNAADYIDKMRIQRWAKSQITQRHLYGFTIELNKKDTIGISPSIGIDGWYEPEQTELLRKVLKKKMTFVDIGANIGWYTLLSAKLVGTEGLVVAYEPEPTNFSFLAKSIKENGFLNVKAFQKCVSNTIGKRTLSININPGGHSIVRESKSGNGILVDSVTLDASLKELGIQSVDFLKIDAEGAEPEIIEGALENVREAKIKNILIEWTPKRWLAHKDLFERLVERYDVYRYIRSPRLIKKISANGLYSLPATNLYFHYRKEA